ncbi:MAG: alkaline phosphatase D family protein, partial [Flavobacteriales bacterium]
SCAYINEPEFDRPGTPYGKDLGIFDIMAEKDPDLMLWLGDNIYLREVDYTTLSGFFHRYTHTRSQPELQNLLQACPNYAIWDDHDYGPNDGNRSYIHKDWALKSFELFWGNPSYGLPDANGGITTQFAFNDIDFFLLDNRYFRSNHTVKQDQQGIFGEEQVDWLIEALKFSKSPFKIVASGGQFLSSFAEYENHALYAEERKNLIKRIEKEGITGVIFLTGDRHSTELSVMNLKKGNKIYDLTASPLTSGAYDHLSEPNKNRIDGTMVCTQNFATLNFTGDTKNRKCVITIYNSKGEEQWSQMIEKW